MCMKLMNKLVLKGLKSIRIFYIMKLSKNKERINLEIKDRDYIDYLNSLIIIE